MHAAELRSLMGSNEMRAVQLRRITGVAQTADGLANSWAHALGQAERSVQQFVWFFDIVTQNGDMKGIGYSNVEAFLNSSGSDDAVNVICDWLQNAPPTSWGRDDSVKNAARWQNNVSPSALDLFVLSYLRASVSAHRAHCLVMNRKGTLAVKTGHVNGTLFDFSSKF